MKRETGRTSPTSVDDRIVGEPSELLKQVPLFQGLSNKKVKRLARDVLDLTFRPGQELTAEGNGPGVIFFIIRSGMAVVSVDGQERRTLGPRDYFGEIALIDEGARTATVTAETEVKCYGLTVWHFRPLVQSDAAIAWPLLEAMAARLRELEQTTRTT
jgi:CRP-like cAMP-binding protein